MAGRLALPEQPMVPTVEMLAIGITVSEVGPRPPKWVIDILKYLDANELPEDKLEAKKIKNRVVLHPS